MTSNKEILLTLDIFEGPLILLYHLVQRCEIDIYEVALKAITEQYFSMTHEEDAALDSGVDFITTASSLLLLKSRRLLPKHDEEEIENIEIAEEDPNFDIIHHLVDYCRFKQAASGLVAREQEQAAYYTRGAEGPTESKKPTGLKSLTLDDLAELFQQIAAKAADRFGVLHEEEWRVSDKIAWLRHRLIESSECDFDSLFSSLMKRQELIVTFLAVLELMKLGEMIVAKEVATGKIIIKSTKY
jgi:segregation and condensation protein A